jgi:hypothetical protein
MNQFDSGFGQYNNTSFSPVLPTRQNRNADANRFNGMGEQSPMLAQEVASILLLLCEQRAFLLERFTLVPVFYLCKEFFFLQSFHS